MKLPARYSRSDRTNYYSPYFTGNARPIFLKLRRELNRDCNIDWNILRSITCKLSIGKSRLPYIRKFLMGILKLLIKYKCQNMDVIAGMIQLAFYIDVTDNGNSMLQLGIIYAEDKKAYSSISHEIILLFHISYERKDAGEPSRHDFYQEANYGYNFEFLKILLKFGVTMFPNFTWEEITYNGILYVILGKDRQPWRLMELTEEINLPISGVLRRFLWVVMDYVERVIQNNLTMENILRCQKLLFQDVSSPAIPIGKIKNLLVDMLPEPEALEFVHEYEIHFPECKAPYAPRELKHLCRYKIRQSLRKAKTIHYGIPSLPLTKKLKKYLMLQDNDYYGEDYFKINDRFPRIPPESFHYPESTLSFLDSL